MVGVDHQPGVGTDRFAHRGDNLQVLGGVEADLDLDRMEPRGDVPSRLLGIVGDPVDPVFAERAGGIGPDAVAEAPAEEGRDRDAEALALDVPESDVDAGEGRDREAALALVPHEIVELLPEPLGLQRIAADQARSIGSDDGGIGQRRAEAFPPAGRAVVADDLDQAVLPSIEAHRRAFEGSLQPVIENVGVNLGDLHGRHRLLARSMSSASIPSSAAVRSTSGGRTSPASKPTRRTPALMAATA